MRRVRVTRVISTNNRQTGCRNVTCHILRVYGRLDSEFSMSANALEKVAVEVYQIKKAHLQI